METLVKVLTPRNGVSSDNMSMFIDMDVSIRGMIDRLSTYLKGSKSCKIKAGERISIEINFDKEFAEPEMEFSPPVIIPKVKKNPSIKTYK